MKFDIQELTIEVFDKIESGEIFATNTIVDNHLGCNLAGSGVLLRFVAVKGWANDWAVYAHVDTGAEGLVDWIRQNGDKVFSKENIYRCVPCTEEVLQRYRY